MTRWLIVGITIALLGSSTAGCAMREARVDDDYSGSALARDVPEPERQFPFGPLPFIAHPDPDQR